MIEAKRQAALKRKAAYQQRQKEMQNGSRSSTLTPAMNRLRTNPRTNGSQSAPRTNNNQNRFFNQNNDNGNFNNNRNNFDNNNFQRSPLQNTTNTALNNDNNHSNHIEQNEQNQQNNGYNTNNLRRSDRKRTRKEYAEYSVKSQNIKIICKWIFTINKIHCIAFQDDSPIQPNRKKRRTANKIQDSDDEYCPQETESDYTSSSSSPRS